MGACHERAPYIFQSFFSYLDMKQFITGVSLGLLLMGGVTAQAATFATGGLKYHIINDSTCEVIKQSNPVYTGEIVIPETTTNPADDKTYTIVAVYDEAFMNTTITKVTLPNTIKKLKKNCFLGCSQLTSINLPEGLDVLDTQALGNTGLTHVTLPSTLSFIGHSCFFGVPLDGITIPASVVSIDGQAFGNCNNLEYLRVDENNPSYCAVDNVLYNKSKTMVLGYPGKCNVNVVLADEVRSIVGNAGYGNKSLESLTLNEGLEVLDLGTASHSSMKFKTIKFSSTIKEIGPQAFIDSPGIKELELPASLNKIRMDAFTYDDAIEKITCHAVKPPVLETAAFPTKVFSVAEVYVPEGSYLDYSTDPQWSKFRKMIAIKEGEAAANSASVKARLSAKKMPLTNPVNLVFSVYNEGKNQVSSLSVKLTVGDYTTPELTFSDLSLKSGATGNVLMPMDLSSASLQPQRYNMTIEITKVNGEANPSDNPKFDFKVEFVNTQDLTGAGEATYCKGLDQEALDHLGGKVEHIDAALLFKDPNLVGANVVGAKILGLQPSGIGNVSLWSSSKLAAKPDGEIMEVAPITFGNEQFVDVATPFVNPVTLTADGTYFGVSLDVIDGGSCRPIAVYEPKDQKGNIYISTDYKEWDEGYTQFGSLGMILYVQTGDQIKGVKVASTANISAGVKGQPFEVGYNVQNYTNEPISELEYTYTVGSESKSGKIELETPISAYMTQLNTITVPYDAIANAGLYDGTLNITKVNGSSNGQSSDFATSVSVGDFQTLHRPLMEEYTGTACGYCPRGTVGMNEMAKRYPDFISAAYHNYNTSDPMHLKTSMPVRINGAPGCMLDRNGLTLDPYWGSDLENMPSLGIETDYLKQASVLAPCDISLKTSWIAEGDNQKAGIKVEPTVTYSFVEKDQKYGVGYLLTIDSIGQPGEANWQQLNYVHIDRYDGEDDLIKTIYAGGGFDHYHYNHVVFDMTAAKIANPVDYTAIKIGQPYNFTKTFKLAENSLDDTDWLPKSDLSKVNVIAFVIDGNGIIRNAVKVRAGEESVGVSPILAEDVEGPVSYYDLLGRRILNPEHGIYIRVQGNKASKVAL